MTDRGTVRAELDGEGRLVRADEALLALEARAGGGLGRPLALAPLATVARLARRLAVPVSRPVRVADAEVDLDLWVRAEPDREGVTLAIAGWRESRPWRASPVHVDIAPEPVIDEDDVRWESDGAMRLVQLSLDAGERFGADATALLGRPLTGAFHLVEDEDGNLPILGALALRRSFTGQRATVRMSGRAVELAGRARLDPAGNFAGFVGSVRPRRDGAQADILSEAFTGRLDQALREPLARIITNADSIHAQAEGPLRADYVDYAADIASAGRHLIGLIDDLVDLQAIERADFHVEAEPLDLADVARRAAGLLQVRAADAGVRIDRPAPGESLPATGEFRRALQIMVNLIGNAVRYSPRGGMVWVRIEREDHRALVVVADQGRGIAAEDQARIFEKFERLDRMEPGGSGLGLYIARRLARAMGGDLTVESAPGQGARFTLALPLG